jgi:thiamine-phosphate pyrophosphorylase
VRLPVPPFLLITDRLHVRGDISDVAELAFLAGCRWLSLREKDLTPGEQCFLLRDILRLAERHGARVTLHGEAKLARQAGAQGVHLPAGGDAAEARGLFGPDALIGLSIHTIDEARRADARHLDYVVAGPVFETESKPGYGPALGIDGLAQIANVCAVPLVAIGGINPENALECRAAGAAGIAVMGNVMRAKNPAGAVMKLIASLSRPLA